MLLAVSLLAASLFVGLPAGADDWRQIGPEGGTVMDLERVASEPSVVYAGAAAGGLFRSADGGRTWSTLLPVLPAAAVPEVAVGPDGRVVVASDGGTRLWHSADAGARWSAGTVTGGGSRGDFDELAVAPSDPSVVYAAGRGVVRSDDGGATWAPADGGRPDADVRGLAIHPQDADVVYAATFLNGAFRSDDGGATWSPILAPEEGEGFYDVAAAPADGDTVYLAGTSGLRVSRDGGATWGPWRGPKLILVEADPEVAGRVLVVEALKEHGAIFFTHYPVHRVDGYGTVWEQLGDFNFLHDLLPGAADRPHLVSADFDGVLRHAGSGWAMSNQGLQARGLTAFTLAPSEPSAVLATTGQRGLLVRSRDGGAHFPPAARNVLNESARQATGVVADPADPGTAFVLADRLVIVEPRGDDGSPWRGDHVTRVFEVPSPVGLAVHPARPRRLFAASNAPDELGGPRRHRLRRSGDRGATWTVLATPGAPERPLHAVAVDPREPARLYVAAGVVDGDGGAVLESDDAGATWAVTGLDLPAPLLHLQAHPDGPGAAAATRLFGVTAGGALYTRGAAGGWERIGAGLPAEAVVTALDASPRGDGELVVGTEEHGVFRRAAAGAAFHPVGGGLPALPVEGVGLVPGSGVVFAGLGAGGLWRTGVPTACAPAAPGQLCLRGGRFRAEVDWATRQGTRGGGVEGDLPAALDPGTWGWFWFFREGNAELAVKLLDGRPVNGHWWVFFASMTDVAFDLRVTDLANRAFRVYRNPAGRLASRGDTVAFLPVGGASPSSSAAAATVPASAAASTCGGGPGALCLQGGRFRVEAEWEDFEGGRGTATGEPLGDGGAAVDDSGYLWFFRRGNPELFVKVLDGRPVNGEWWVFYGALTNVGFRLTVTDTVAGRSRSYDNPVGRFASGADTAF